MPLLPHLPLRGRGRPRTQAPELRVTLITNDYQIPDIDWPVYRTVLHFLKDLRPDFHYINGDYLDLYSQSRYTKDPSKAGQTAEELEIANRILDELTEACPNSIIRFTMGNHEARMTQRLYENPDLIPYFRSASSPDEVIARALSLDERGIDWVPYKQHFNHYGMIITHGQSAGVNPARTELLRYGMSGLSGHVNRNCTFEMKTQHGFAKWWTLGGLTSHKLDFMPVNNWVHGIGVLYQVVGSSEFTFYPIEIVNAKFIFNGRLYTPDGVFAAA